MVIAHGKQDTTIRRRSRKIAVTDGVTGAIDARTFAVPQGKHTIEFPVAAKLGLLGTPARCGS